MINLQQCEEIKHAGSVFKLSTDGGVHVYISDSSIQPSYRLVAGGKPISTDGHSPTSSHYRVHGVLTKKRSSKSECKFYSDPASTLSDCINKAIEKSMMKLLGCIPPWMSNLKGDVHQLCYYHTKCISAFNLLIVKTINNINDQRITSCA